MCPCQAKCLMRMIKGYPWYQISECGRVWSLRYRNPRELKLSPNRNRGRYLQVALHRDRKQSTKKVHRLVLETFVGPCPKGMEAYHLNDNPADNRLTNLKWATHQENIKRRKRYAGEVSGRATVTNELAEILRKRAKNRYRGIVTDLGKEFQIPLWTVSRILLGQTYQ